MKDDVVKYLVFDVESVPDSKLISRVKYPGEEIDAREAVHRYQQELLEASDGVSEFIPVTFQYPISICIAKVRGDFYPP